MCRPQRWRVCRRVRGRRLLTRRRADTRGRPRPIDAVRSSRQDACRGNGEGELSPMLGDGLSLAAVNGRSSCVVSGPDVAIAELERRLAERSIATKSLRTSHAFHSAMMDPIVDAFACVAAGVSLAAEDPRRVERHWDLAHCGRGDGSGVLGETSPADRALRRRGDPSGQSADCVLLEVGPGRTLASFATRPGTPSPVTTLRQRDEAGDDRAHLLKALGSLWACGGRVPWQAVHQGKDRRRVILPTYPFARQRFWIEPARPSPMANVPVPVAVETEPVHERPELTVSYFAPSSDSERELCSIWQGLIGVDRVGTDDDFSSSAATRCSRRNWSPRSASAWASNSH